MRRSLASFLALLQQQGHLTDHDGWPCNVREMPADDTPRSNVWSTRASVISRPDGLENLLREADARDESGNSAQGYVTSDSGRVYLFLAHASGRLA